MKRCDWANGDPLYEKYHDEEWGVPLFDDDKLFEFLVLEGMQAGLSWLTVLRKRENFRHTFDDFNPVKVAEYGQDKVDELLQDKGIIRNKQKILAAIANAKAFLVIQEEFGSFKDHIWKFVDVKPVINQWSEMSEIPAKSDLAEVISADLKKRGFRFVGPTIIYAHMQATGMVNDHVISCPRWNAVQI